MKQASIAKYLASISIGLAFISGIALSPVQAQPAVDTAKPADNRSQPPVVTQGKPANKATDYFLEISNVKSPRDVASGVSTRNKPPGPNQPPVKR